MEENDKKEPTEEEMKKTIINFLCPSDRPIENWNWFQRQLSKYGNKLDDFYTLTIVFGKDDYESYFKVGEKTCDKIMSFSCKFADFTLFGKKWSSYYMLVELSTFFVILGIFKFFRLGISKVF